MQRTKTGFHLTNDVRSIQILTHELALRLLPAFLREYVLQDDYPFDRLQIHNCMESVLHRKPGFLFESILFMQTLCAAVFVRNLAVDAHARFKPDPHKVHFSPELVRESHWAALEQAWSTDPAVPLQWHTEDEIAIPLHLRHSHHLVVGSAHWVLTGFNALGETLSVSGQTPYLTPLWEYLVAEPSSRESVGFLLDVLDVPLREFTQLLDLLHQCGFIERHPAPKPAREQVPNATTHREKLMERLRSKGAVVADWLDAHASSGLL